MLDGLSDLERLGDVAPDPAFGRVAVVVHGEDARLAVIGRGGGLRVLAGAPGGVNRCVWHPDGTRLLVSVDPVGAERDRLAELDASTGAPLWSTDRPDAVHVPGPIKDGHSRPYHPAGTAVAYASNARDPAALDVVVRDLATGAETVVLRGDDRYYPVAWSPDGEYLLVKRVHQNTEQDLFRCCPATGEVRRVTRVTARYHAAAWTADGTRLVVLTDAGRDLLAPALLDVAGPDLDGVEPRWLAEPPGPVEVSRLAVDAGGRYAVWGEVRAGRAALTWHDLGSGETRPVAAALPGVPAEPANKNGHSALHLGRDGRTLITRLGSPTRPAEAYRIDLVTGDARRLTRLGARVPAASLVEPRHVTIRNRDGLPMPAQLFRPPPDRAAGGRVPVVLRLHGGPEDSQLLEYAPDVQALLRHGIGVLAPDIRGSVGHGRAYQRLSIHDWGGGDVRDVVDCAGFLAGLDWVDAGRLGVMGASYGGFLTLACLVQHPRLWSAAVDIFGPSDLLRDAEAMPSHWRRRLRGWLGDLDDPADRARLVRSSPITHVERIAAPLLVVQGAHDPRVPPEQSNVLVAHLTRLGRPVSLVTMADEGHGFDGHAAWEQVVLATVDWFRRHLSTAPA